MIQGGYENLLIGECAMGAGNETAFYVTATSRLGAEPNRNDSRFPMRTPLCDSKWANTMACDGVL